jgi:hypothetical protein
MVHPRVLRPILPLVCVSIALKPWLAQSFIALAPAKYWTPFFWGPPPSSRPPAQGFYPPLSLPSWFHTSVCGFHPHKPVQVPLSPLLMSHDQYYVCSYRPFPALQCVVATLRWGLGLKCVDSMTTQSNFYSITLSLSSTFFSLEIDTMTCLSPLFPTL